MITRLGGQELIEEDSIEFVLLTKKSNKATIQSTRFPQSSLSHKHNRKTSKPTYESRQKTKKISEHRLDLTLEVFGLIRGLFNFFYENQYIFEMIRSFR